MDYILTSSNAEDRDYYKKMSRDTVANLKVRELHKYIQNMNPSYEFCGYLCKEDAKLAALAIWDETHPTLMNTPISWDDYFMGIARLSAMRSKDPKTQVGACLVDTKTNHILGIGYNGMPAGTDDTAEVWSDENKHIYVVHAEANAILNAGAADLTGAAIYVTEFPCNECAKLLAQKRISKVVYDGEKYLNKDIGTNTLKILSNANIKSCKWFPSEGFEEKMPKQ